MKEDNEFIDNLQSLLKEDLDVLSANNHSRNERKTLKIIKHQSDALASSNNGDDIRKPIAT